MNPIGLYTDPALDDLITQADGAHRSASSHRKNGEPGIRSVSDSMNTNSNSTRQPAPEAYRGAPISYRGLGPDADPALHRSFSQRAKNRPFAEEAFRDDSPDSQTVQRPSQTSKPIFTEYHQPVQIPPPSSQVTDGHPIQAPETNGRRPHREAGSPAEKPRRRTSDGAGAGRTAIISGPSIARSATMRDAANQTEEQQSQWASDRSPLQKLEVKLTDISKEEKRARMQEAEMRLMRDQKMGKVPQRPHRETIRSSSGSHAKRRQSEGRSSYSRDSSAYEPESPSIKQASLLPKQQDVPKRTVSLNNGAVQGPARSISIRQTPKGTVVEPIRSPPVTAIPPQQSRPKQRHRDDERPISERERNASHQAALSRLTSGGSRQSSKGDSRKPQKGGAAGSKSSQSSRAHQRKSSPVPVDLSSFSGGDPGLDFSSQKSVGPIESRTPQSPPQQSAGLDVQHPKSLRSVDSPPVSLTDTNKQRQRKSSVSFKEPFDRRRPVDEWKTAVTACMTADDFSTVKVEQADAPDLATPWWEKSPGRTKRDSRAKPATTGTLPPQPIDDRTAEFTPKLYLKCGPLLRYAGLKRSPASKPGAPKREFWRGSIMIVTQDSSCSYTEIPTLRLFAQPKKLHSPPLVLGQGDQLAPEDVDPIAGLMKIGRTGKARFVRPVDQLKEEKDLSQIEDDNGIYETSPSPLDSNESNGATYDLTNKRTFDKNGEELGRYKEVRGVRLYADPDRDVTFWRFNVEIELGPTERHVAYRINKGAATGFWVPAQGQTMNMMFHSCNGFSLSVDTDKFSGPDPLWRDVLNSHQAHPFHVMIGGGDQIYNDRVMTETQHFADWTKIRNPHHKHKAPFSSEMKEELESFYLERYCMWFSQGLFAMANASIPMVNIWDDHDIIDGFGSYPHEFMRSPVFSGLGNVAFKYYMLFQHQSLEAMTEKDEPSWLLGHEPGPYITTKSRSLFLELGESVTFLGIDCRTERTKNNVLSEHTLELILDRCRREMVEGRTKHLIVLLGVPIAYPRLVWLENVLTSRAMDPIKAMGRAGIIKTGFLNKFDGGVEILDDLDDHWTASHHKEERNILIQQLQELAAEKSARVTILGGDVHLAAIGQFYSNPKLKIPKDKDHRYMPNIISSAIVNTPPPDIMADVINKRNKVHHLDIHTDENMIPMFTHDVNDKRRNNVHMLPRRNWCAIREYHPGETPPSTPSTGSFVSEEVEMYPDHDRQWAANEPPKRRLSLTKEDFNPRNLIRRLSSRNAPPSSFRNGQNVDRPQQQRATSFDGVTSDSGQHFGRPPSHRASSVDDMADVPALRPNFHRRPTNLSERAAKKGNVPALDTEGNEFDVNDHINLEGGLDITLNCEIDQKDPAGITAPYRILIPALWYDGSSDREKLDVQKPGRTGSVLKKFGLAPRGVSKAANNQGAGNWGKDSETGSQDSIEVAERPRRSFSLFGSRRKRMAQPFAEQVLTQRNAPPTQSTQISQPVTSAQQTRMYGNDDSDDDDSLLDSLDESVDDMEVRQSLNKKVAKSATADANLPYEADTGPEHDSQVKNTQQTQTPARRSHQQPFYAPPQQPGPPSLQHDASTASHESSRRGSYTIGGSDALQPRNSRSEHPYDADAFYVDQQSHAQQARQSAMPQRTLSKQERILGIADTSNNYQNPQQTQLRGNGILGKNIAPSAFPDRTSSHRPTSSSGSSQQTNRLSRGYDGIEAYKEPKTKRRWSVSIREKARGLLDTVEGKRRNDLYSDDDEEDYWEGPRSEEEVYQGDRQNGFQGQRSASARYPGQSNPYDKRY